MTLDEQVQALRAKFGDRIPHHTCGLCGVMVAYQFVGEQLFFDPSCGCTSGDSLQQRDISDFHQFLGMNPGLTERYLAGTYP